MIKTYVLYHGACSDGFGAAWSAWKALGDEAEYIPVTYGTPVPELKEGSDVVMIDFAYSRDIMVEIQKNARTLLVLDHHKTAQKEIGDLRFSYFDMDKSGATLAWEHFHPNESTPDFLRYVEDKDLWRFKLPHSREINLAIQSYPMKFEVWSGFANANALEQLRKDGVTLTRFMEQLVDQSVGQASIQEIGGYYVPVVNTTAFPSEVGHALCKAYPNRPFSAYYFDRKDGTRHWGFRSVGEFDVSEVAKKLGGGGHRNSAGFIESI